MFNRRPDRPALVGVAPFCVVARTCAGGSGAIAISMRAVEWSHHAFRGDGWTRMRQPERRLVPLAPRTLERLEEIAAKVREHGGVSVEPMQLAALLLEKTTDDLNEAEAEKLVRPKRSATR